MPSMHFFEHRLEVRHILAIAAFRRPANNDRVYLFLSFPLDFWILRHNEDEGEDRRDGLLRRETRARQRNGRTHSISTG